MKKILALALAILMIVTLVSLSACGKKDGENAGDDDEYEYNDDTSKGNSNKNDNDAVGEDELEETGWVAKNDEIVVGVNGVNLREGAGRDFQTVVSLNAGVKLQRTETNGRWHKVTYEGKVCYISAAYTTTKASDFEFVDFAEAEQTLLNVKADMAINLRSTPFYTESDSEANLIFPGFGPSETDGEGESLKLIAKSASGNWYKVSFTGTWGTKTYSNQVCYLKATSTVVDAVNGLPSSTTSSGGATFG